MELGLLVCTPSCCTLRGAGDSGAGSVGVLFWLVVIKVIRLMRVTSCLSGPSGMESYFSRGLGEGLGI